MTLMRPDLAYTWPTGKAYEWLGLTEADSYAQSGYPQPKTQELRSGVEALDLPPPWEGVEGDQTAPPTPHGEKVPGG